MLHVLRWVGCGLVLCWLVGGRAAHAEQRENLSDFEAAGLGEQFTAVRQIQVGREQVQGRPPAKGPSGFAARISTAGNAGLFAKSGGIAQNLLNVSAVELWIYRSPEAAKRGADTIEFRFVEADGRGVFLSKVELTHEGWKQLSLPLRWFRWGEGRVPRWNKIDRWGVWFRDAAEVQIDDVAILRQDDPDIALLQAADYRQIAFPDIKRDDDRELERDHILLATSAKELDLKQLFAHLQQVKAQLERDLSVPDDFPEPAVLLVFDRKESYADFTPRLAKQLQAVAPAPRSDGFTIQGIATSYYDEKFGTLRPVYTHEFVHAVLSRGWRLPNHGEWLQEGLAVTYQLRFHPQADYGKIVADGIAKPENHSPLEELTSGEKVPMNRYWQAATFAEMLATDKKYAPKFKALIEAFAKSGSTKLGPQREAVLGASWETLTSDWKTFCSERYAPAEAK